MAKHPRAVPTEPPSSAAEPIDPAKALAPYIRHGGEKQEARVRRDFWATLKKAGRSFPFAREAIAAFYCATDPATPASARATLFAALAYFVAPVDLVPDFLALIGFGDDMAVLMMVYAVLKTNISDRHRELADAALADPASADASTDDNRPNTDRS
jgi:uncharacterized membrane protein YkvA (DUF1232 family)